jgi:hypothetical protein
MRRESDFNRTPKKRFGEVIEKEGSHRDNIGKFERSNE